MNRGIRKAHSIPYIATSKAVNQELGSPNKRSTIFEIVQLRFPATQQSHTLYVIMSHDTQETIT